MKLLLYLQIESDSSSESDDELDEMEDRTQQHQRPDNNQVQDMEEESSSSEDEAPPSGNFQRFVWSLAFCAVMGSIPTLDKNIHWFCVMYYKY